MFEARLTEASLLKKILDSIKDLVVDVNFDCTENGIQLQSMDNAHVALVVLLLRQSGFESFRCDRTRSLGIKLPSLAKIVKSAGNEDVVTLKAEDDGDSLTVLFESQNNNKVAEYDLKLMDIDSEHLGIPDTEYECTVTMSSTEFQRTCRDLSNMGESVTIECSKEGIRFLATGDEGSASVVLKAGGAVDDKDIPVTINVEQAVSLTFSLKYLLNFAKATPLSSTVRICLSNNVPVLLEYQAAEAGYVRLVDL
ncbi:proliferating cell nuclear antigen [Nowakowskiella sp. JEL0407]|nr:proliferating cell nuclear antigen [Nowakowskiella sp. JEL0407]